MTKRTHDAIVIGSGQGGKPLALALAKAGKRTAVIERGDVGGTCVNTGCTPTKTVVASARVAWLCRRAGDFGVRNGSVEVDFAAVRERKRSIVESFRTGGEKALEEAENLELVRGEASFVGEREIRVQSDGGSSRRLSAELVVIDTGLSPVTPKVEGLDEVAVLDNASVMELDEAPGHLLVLGGGYVGIEFAQAFRRFGSDVTVIDRGAHVLANEDEDVAEAVTKVLRDEDVRIHNRATVRRARKAGGGIELEVEGADGVQKLSGTHLLVAAGRKPNTSALNLEAGGVKTDDSGFVRVNERLETSARGVYAIGDVKGGPAFTHVSYNDFVVLKRNLLEGESATIADRPLVYTVFTDPQLGRVGLNEKQAREKGVEVRVAKLPMERVARALESDDTRGFMKALVDPQTDRILGCTVFGMQGGEVMSMVQIAMLGGLRWQQLRDGMFAHPLLAESLNSLFGALED